MLLVANMQPDGWWNSYHTLMVVVNLLMPRRTQVSPFTEISILF